jgi:hypothetical protein
MSNIKTTGDLREFLVTVMEDVRSAKLNVERASTVIKTAAQINESFYSEIKTKALEKKIGNPVKDIGKLPIN